MHNNKNSFVVALHKTVPNRTQPSPAHTITKWQKLFFDSEATCLLRVWCSEFSQNKLAIPIRKQRVRERCKRDERATMLHIKQQHPEDAQSTAYISACNWHYDNTTNIFHWFIWILVRFFFAYCFSSFHFISILVWYFYSNWCHNMVLLALGKYTCKWTRWSKARTTSSSGNGTSIHTK